MKIRRSELWISQQIEKDKEIISEYYEIIKGVWYIVEDESMVTLTEGFTLNLGNYEFVRSDFGIKLPIGKKVNNAEVDKTFEEAKKTVDRLLSRLLKEARAIKEKEKVNG